VAGDFVRNIPTFGRSFSYWSFRGGGLQGGCKGKVTSRSGGFPLLRGIKKNGENARKGGTVMSTTSWERESLLLQEGEKKEWIGGPFILEKKTSPFVDVSVFFIKRANVYLRSRGVSLTWGGWKNFGKGGGREKAEERCRLDRTRGDARFGTPKKVISARLWGKRKNFPWEENKKTQRRGKVAAKDSRRPEKVHIYYGLKRVHKGGREQQRGTRQIGKWGKFFSTLESKTIPDK